MSYYILEALSELAPGIDLSKLSVEDREELEEDFEHHIKMCLEVESYTYPSSGELRDIEENRKVQELRTEIKELRRREEIYHDDIKRNFGGQYNYADTSTGRIVIEDGLI